MSLPCGVIARMLTGTVADTFHASGAAQLCPPDNSAHISSHNAVQPQPDPTAKLTRDEQYRQQVDMRRAAAYRRSIDSAYAKAEKRAAKKGRKIPPREQYYDHWGYPYVYYGAYVSPIWWAPGMYSYAGPGYIASCGSGTPGSCVAGTCGGGVAAGGCGGPGVSVFP